MSRPLPTASTKPRPHKPQPVRSQFNSGLAQCSHEQWGAMKDIYRGYYPVTDDEIDELWKSGLVVIDTNVLLNMYRTTPASRRAVIQSLQGVQERLWLPHQVGLEFHKMREAVRQDARKAHREKAQQIVTDAAKVRKLAADAAALNVDVDPDSALRNALTQAADALAEAVRAGQKPFDEEAIGDDELLSEIEGLFRPHQIGSRFQPSDLEGLRREAEARYSRSVPPGYADQGKGGERGFGDFFIWKQLMAAAINHKAGVIFVTNDEKPDWKLKGRARPELLQEFHEETGQLLHIYNPQAFTGGARARDLWNPDSDSEADDVAAELETYVDTEKTDTAGTNSWASVALGLSQSDILRAALIAAPMLNVQKNIGDWLPKSSWLTLSQLGMNEAFVSGVSSAFEAARRTRLEPLTGGDDGIDDAGATEDEEQGAD